MTVFVLTESYLCVDSGECTLDTKVFNSIDDAKIELEERIRNARIDFKDVDFEEDHYVDGDMTYSIWEKEFYMSNHIDIIIKECEVL